MGPHLLHPGVSREQRDSAVVLPLHPSFAPLTLQDEAGLQRAASAPVRRKVVPVSRRPWEVVILTAAPGVAPRRYAVARWQARLVLSIFAATLLLACVAVFALVQAIGAPAGDDDLASVRTALRATQDSLTEMRAPSATGAPAALVPPSGEPATGPARTSSVKGASNRRILAMPRALFSLPVIGALASGFSAARMHPLLHITRPHLGVDLAAPRGTRVSAPAAGQVIFVGRKMGFGLVVELDHGGGVTTRYAHLRSSAVERGEHVTRGEAIAAVGTSGLTTGPHLHYEVLVHGQQVDPLRYRFGGETP